MSKKNIVVFASGSGSNALNLIHYFNSSETAVVNAIFTNNKNAGVISKATENRVAVQMFNKSDFYETNQVIDWVKIYKPDLIVLAGFLWKIPSHLIAHYPNKIINIHPALLPAYGGKGMYGHHVHEAVVANKETESGITIHFVNEHYDEGTILLQKRVALLPADDAQTVASKVLELEHLWYAKVIDSILF
jgi:phosphoribosylglycinamide formyltransferase-1